MTKETTSNESVWNGLLVGAWGAFRTAPLWLLAGAIALVGVTQLRDATIPEPTAKAQIGLTDQVVWPFFDVVLSEAEAKADAAEVIAREAVGDSLISYEVSTPDGQGIVEISIVGATEAEALAAAQAASEWVVAQDLTGVNARLIAESNAIAVAEQTASRELVQINADINETVAGFVPNLGEATRRALDLELQVLQGQRDGALRRQQDAQVQAQALQIRTEISNGRVEVVNLSSTGSPTAPSIALPLAVGVGTCLAAAIALNVYARENGRIETAAQVRSVIGLPTVPFPTSPATTVPLARLLTSWREHLGYQMVGVASLPAGFDSPHLMALALKEVGEDISVAEFGLNAVATEALSLTVLDPIEATVDGQLGCDAAVLVAQGRTTLRKLRHKIIELEQRGLPVRAILLRDDE